MFFRSMSEEGGMLWWTVEAGSWEVIGVDGKTLSRATVAGDWREVSFRTLCHSRSVGVNPATTHHPFIVANSHTTAMSMSQVPSPMPRSMDTNHSQEEARLNNTVTQ
jgi:hypothetical protein